MSRQSQHSTILPARNGNFTCQVLHTCEHCKLQYPNFIKGETNKQDISTSATFLNKVNLLSYYTHLGIYMQIYVCLKKLVFGKFTIKFVFSCRSSV